MKNIVYYFTGTGNSLAVARKLSEKLGDCKVEAIVPLMKMDKIAPKAEKIGIVFPIYFQGLPEIIEGFAKKLDTSGANYVYGVVTIGNKISYTKYVLTQLKDLLEENGNRFDAGYNVLLVDNYVPMLKIPPEEKQKERNTKGFEKVEKIVSMIKAGEKTIEAANRMLGMFAKGMYKKWRKGLPESDNKFYVQDSCNSCTICEQVCPVENIKMDDGKPSWNNNCQECLACLHFCPQKSIQKNKKTEKNGRYHNPEISMKDIINQKRAQEAHLR